MTEAICSLSDVEKQELLRKEPQAEKCSGPFMGATEIHQQN